MSKAIIRPDSHGHVDDVVITCDTFRLERIDKGSWCIAVYRGEERVCFSLTSSKGSIRAIVTEDDFDCVDDTPKKAK